MAKHVERERKYGRGRREVGWAHNVQRVLIQKKSGENEQKKSKRRWGKSEKSQLQLNS